MELLVHLVGPDTITPAKALVTPANITEALTAMNFLAFAAFGIEKARSQTGALRFPNTTPVARRPIARPGPRAPALRQGLRRRG
jgi:hypothetical protein